MSVPVTLDPVVREALIEYVTNRIGPMGIDCSQEELPALVSAYVMRRYAEQRPKFHELKRESVLNNISTARMILSGTV